MMGRLLVGFLVLLTVGSAAPAESPAQLTARDAIRWALAENPELTVVRQRREFAEAGIVLARLYPHNPVLTVTPRRAAGPTSAGITQPFTFETSLTVEVERPGQRRLRQQAAQQSLSRTEWEIAAHELAVVGKTMRAFNAVIYHQEKLRLLAEHVRLAKRGLEDNQKLREKKKEKLPAGELVLLQFEIRDAEAHLVNGRGPLVAAEQDLRAVLGGAVLPPVVGSLAITMRDWPAAELQAQARTLRPDLQARQAAQAEATAALALERTARFGNPVVGPSYGSQETNVQYLGATLEFPLPVCNRKQGEIRLRAAELHKAALEIRQLEIEIDQEIDSALLRFRQVQESIRLYRDDFLPALQARYQELQKLYNENDPGVDVQQVLELYNRLLRVRASYLDALYEHGQIEVDLALAVGDLELAFDP